MNEIRKMCLSAKTIRKLVKVTIPLYQKLAGDRKFAAAWSTAVRRADLNKLERLLKTVVYNTKPISISTNSIGYFIDHEFPRPVELYSNATFIKAGKAQFHFNKVVLRNISKTILPLYQRISKDPIYAQAIVKSIRSHNTAKLSKLVRQQITSPNLRKLKIDSSGFDLCFRYSIDPHTYHHAFFRDIPY